MRIQRLLIVPFLGFGLILTALLSLGQPATTLARSGLLPLGDEIIVTPGQSIQAVIDAANPGDTIVVQVGIYTESLTLSKAVSLTGISSATTIIRAVPGQRVLTVTGSIINPSVVISGLTFMGGDVTGGLACPVHCGGGISIDNGAQPLIQNVTIVNNRAGGNGGGIYADIDSLLVLSSTNFISNTANLSGGGATAGGTAIINGGRFVGNMAGQDGGGLNVLNILILINTDFISNTAGVFGGGAVADGTVIVNGGRFVGNIAGFEGGGLNAQSTLTLSGTKFINNTADTGGGGVVSLGPATIWGGYFERNVTDLDGGGLATNDKSNLRDTIFIDNVAAEAGGGATLIGPATVSGGRFEGNVADHGGGLSAVDTLVISDTEFINNTADNGNGGGVSANGLTTITRGHFAGNMAGTSGGGLVTINMLVLNDTVFTGNIATFGGGGASAAGSATVMGGCFEQNRCTEEIVLDCVGGGLIVGQNLALTSTKFIDNRAALGGGLAYAGHNAHIVNALFARNAANGGAGLVLNSSGRVVILHTTIADTNLNPGQAIAVAGGTIGLTNTLIANHTTGIIQAGGTVFEDYNLYFNIPNPNIGLVTSGGHSLTGDPKFIDPANNNYRLDVGSAAIDRGTDVGVLIDIEGNARPQGDGFDIGAYETQAGAPVFTKALYLPIIHRNTP